ncbi:MAG: protein kinase [Planctomycetota bacterium]
MPTLDDIRLGQLAVAQGLCLPMEVEECLAAQLQAEQEARQDRLGEILVLHGYLTRSQLARLLNTQREAEQHVSRIGPYDLVRKLGEGGMGAVYQAQDTRTKTVVALKVLPRSRAKDQVFLQRFEHEARAAFELDHPNIVHGLDVGEADGYHFIVMEFVKGRDVYQLLERKGRLGEQEALDILQQIASALDHIHGENLIHRDIKPENIIVTAEGVAKLTDMGLAIDTETMGRRRITRAGIAMGTPFYLSPEQIEGKTEADIRADIYSLGSTVYEMVTGRPPFEGETPAVVMLKHLNEQVPSPREIDHAISLPFCHMLEKMMAKDPAERYQTPAELSADIARVKQGQTPLGVLPPPGKSSVARPQAQQDQARQAAPQAAPPAAAKSENFEWLEPLKPGPAGQTESRVGSGLKPRAKDATRSRLGEQLAAANRAKPAPAATNGRGLKIALFVGVIVVVVVLVLIALRSIGE